jgi:uncharacterized protein YjbI with pentapeptide repeats
MDFSLQPFEFAKKWIPQLFEALVKIRKERQTELSEIANTFGDPIELAKYYVEPSCQQLNPIDYSEDENVVREPMFERLEAFISGEVSRRSNHMFVLSDAGMGKTSLLVMLKLAHLTAFWPPSYTCVLLKLGPSTLDQVQALSDKRRTVLLLDALDEDPRAWKRVTARIDEILRATQTFRRVILTCRTQFFSANDDPFNRRGQVEVGGFLCSVIYCSLFTDQQVRTYLQRRFPNLYENPVWRDRVSSILSGMGFLRMRPMLLAHIEDLLESRQAVWNEYTIFRALVDAWLMREQRKAENPPPDFGKQLKKACRQVAVQMLLTGRRYTTAQEQEIFDFVWQQESAYEGFSVGGRSLLNKDSDGNYRFSHFSIQEALIVEFLLGNPKSAKGKGIRVTDFMNKIAVAWMRQASPAVLKGRDYTLFDFSGQDLSGVDLSGVDLGSVRLTGSRLSGSLFRAANLSKANLRGADLRGADLTHARLIEADLSEAVLADTSCVGADFRKAILAGADLRDADLSDANLSGASLPSASLQNAVLRGADCSVASWKGADFSGADFEGAIVPPGGLGDVILDAKASEERTVDIPDLEQDLDEADRDG